jgi:hypothetical protein
MLLRMLMLMLIMLMRVLMLLLVAAYGHCCCKLTLPLCCVVLSLIHCYVCDLCIV